MVLIHRILHDSVLLWASSATWPQSPGDSSPPWPLACSLVCKAPKGVGKGESAVFRELMGSFHMHTRPQNNDVCHRFPAPQHKQVPINVSGTHPTFLYLDKLFQAAVSVCSVYVHKSSTPTPLLLLQLCIYFPTSWGFRALGWSRDGKKYMEGLFCFGTFYTQSIWALLGQLRSSMMMHSSLERHPLVLHQQRHVGFLPRGEGSGGGTVEFFPEAA